MILTGGKLNCLEKKLELVPPGTGVSPSTSVLPGVSLTSLQAKISEVRFKVFSLVAGSRQQIYLWSQCHARSQN
jgi:hypothetical protein